jgi:hypothetical protein
MPMLREELVQEAGPRPHPHTRTKRLKSFLGSDMHVGPRDPLVHGWKCCDVNVRVMLLWKSVQRPTENKNMKDGIITCSMVLVIR